MTYFLFYPKQKMWVRCSLKMVREFLDGVENNPASYDGWKLAEVSGA